MTSGRTRGSIRHVLSQTTAIVGVTVALLAATDVRQVEAQQVWDGATADWNTAANWSTNDVPDSDPERAFFTGNTPTAVTFSAGTVFGGITFDVGAPTYSIQTDGNLVVIRGAVINNSGVRQNLIANATNGVILMASDAGEVRLATSGPGALLQFDNNGQAVDTTVSLSNGSLLYVTKATGNVLDIGSLDGGGLLAFVNQVGQFASIGGLNTDTVYGGRIGEIFSGTGGLVKVGTGRLTLGSGALNFYSGTTSINGGVLNIQNFSALGTTAAGTTVVSGAALELQGGLAVGAEALTLSGTGVGGSGALRNVSGNNSYAGAVTLAADTRIQSDTGVLTLSGNIGGDVAGRVLTVGGAGSGVISGAIGANVGGLAKDGAGTWSLTGANTSTTSFTGTANVTAGTLRVNGTFGDLAPAGGLNQAQLNVGAGAANSGTLQGTGIIAGNVAINGGGTLSAGNSPGTLTINGNVALNAGSSSIFELNTPNVVGGANNDFVTVGGNLSVAGTLNLQTTGGAAVASGYYTLFDVAGTTTGSFGTVNNGGATASNASQIVTNGGASPSRFNVLLSNGAQNVQFWDGANQNANGAVDGGTGTWNTANTNWTTVDGTFNDRWRSSVGVFGGTAGTVTVAGTQSFEGLQFSTTGYTLTGGGLTALADSGLGSANASITVDGGVTATIASTINGSAGVTKFGTGALVLSGINTYSGGTEITSGAVSVSADANLGAASSGLSFSGGTLRTTGTFASTRNIAISSTGTVSTAGGVTTTLSGVISGAGSLTATGTGNLILSGANPYSGGTQISGGGFTLASGGSLASDATNASVFTNNGTVSGSVANSGTTTNTGGVTGDVTNSSVFANSGTIGGSVANTGSFTQTAGSIGSTVTNSAAFTISGGTITGPISNTGGFTSNGAATATGSFSNTDTGTLAVTAGSLSGLASLENTSSASAGVSVATGASLSANALTGTNASSVTEVNGTLSFADAPYAGLFTGSGRIVQTGGTFTASASNTSTQSFSGIYDLGGAMIVSGTFGDLDPAGGLNGARVNVNSGGQLGGTGTIAGSVFAVGGTVGGTLRVTGDTTLGAGSILRGNPTIGGNLAVGSGAVVSPGNSPGTVTVNGNVTFAPGSTYLVETVPGSGVSDLIAAGGTATLTGGQVRHIGLDGTYLPTQTYTILTAQGGVTSQFAGATSDYLFLSPSLGYSANAVTLRLDRNDIRFASVATTANQRAAATGLEGLSFANAAFTAATVLDAPNARAAFDQLSGEVHASAKTGRLEDARFLRNTAMDRLDAAFTVLEEQGSDPVEGSVALASTGIEAWISGYGSWGESDGNGNAASLDRDIGGFLVGADGFLTETLRIGVMAGYSEASYDTAGRGSSDVDSTHVGIYAGTMLGAVELKAGASYSVEEIDTSRVLAFGTFRDQLTASYDGGTAQVFGEASYRIDTGFGTSVSPFANLAYVSLDTDGFIERGGAAALRSGDDTTETTFSTLGLKGQAAMPIGGPAVNANATLGWRHAFNDRTPTDTLAFVAGGPAFVVSGVPIAEDAAIVELGLGVEVAPNATLGLHYAGQFANDATDNGVRATFEVKF